MSIVLPGSKILKTTTRRGLGPSKKDKTTDSLEESKTYAWLLHSSAARGDIQVQANKERKTKATKQSDIRN